MVSAIDIGQHTRTPVIISRETGRWRRSCESSLTRVLSALGLTSLILAAADLSRFVDLLDQHDGEINSTSDLSLLE